MTIEPKDLYEGAILAPILIKDFDEQEMAHKAALAESQTDMATDMAQIKANVAQLKVKMDALTARVDQIERKLRWMSWFSGLLALCFLIGILRQPILAALQLSLG